MTKRSQFRDSVITVLLIAAATAVYFAIPVPGRMQQASWALLFSCGVLVLGLAIVVSIRRLLRAGEEARIRGLVLLLTLTVLFFSYADESVASLPDQFAELANKTDALYFNISTLATVGFGDVHATGQLARAAVTLQIVFNLVFLGTAVSLISGFFRRRAQARATAATESRATPGSSGGSGSAGKGSDNRPAPPDPQPGS